MHRVSWNSLSTSPSRRLGSGCLYPELILYPHFLALRTGSRFLLSRQLGDFDQSIIGLTKAIYLPLTPVSPLTPSPFINIAQMFYVLAIRDLFRVKESRRPEDIQCCIRYFRYLHRQWHQVSLKFPVPVTTALVQALAVQVELELGDVDQDIEEMADLCDELLNSDISIEFVTTPIVDFAKAITIRLTDCPQWNIRSENVIGFLRKAILRLPSLHETSIVLIQSLYSRFIALPSDDDYKEGMEILDRILTFRGPGGEPSPHREGASTWAAMFANARFTTYGKPEDLEHAIYRTRAMLDATSIEDPDRYIMIGRISQLEARRLDGKANTRDALSFPPESGRLLSFRELTTSYPGPMAVKPDSTTHMKHLHVLISCIDQLIDIADVKDGIEYCRFLSISYPRSRLASTAQTPLSMLLDRAFQLTHKIEYLNEAISSTRDGINTVDTVSSRVLLLSGLISFLSIRLELQRQEEDFHELMQLFPTVASYDFVNQHGHLPISFNWATTARQFGHPSASTAYDHAMSWMQASLTFAPTIDKQHYRLVATRGLHTILLHYTSYHIDNGHLERAIETLERGRGLLWSEMRSLCTSLDQIRLVDSNLADKLSAVNRELETLTLALSLNNNVDGNTHNAATYRPCIQKTPSAIKPMYS